MLNGSRNHVRQLSRQKIQRSSSAFPIFGYLNTLMFTSFSSNYQPYFQTTINSKFLFQKFGVNFSFKRMIKLHKFYFTCSLFISMFYHVSNSLALAEHLYFRKRTAAPFWDKKKVEELVLFSQLQISHKKVHN